MLTSANGYGDSDSDSLLNVFARFYGLDSFPAYDVKDGTGRPTFNEDVYVKRIEISAETFLLEANERGRVLETR